LIHLYRVLRALYAEHPFDGEGAFRYGGRWSSSGTRVAYASEHESLALLEYFVHLDPEDAPADLVLAVAQVPPEVTRKSINPGVLPANWREMPAPTALAAMGDDFVKKAQFAALIVPSALATTERNWLLNPQHAEFRGINVLPPQPVHNLRRFLRKAG